MRGKAVAPSPFWLGLGEVCWVVGGEEEMGTRVRRDYQAKPLICVSAASPAPSVQPPPRRPLGSAGRGEGVGRGEGDAQQQVSG